MAQVAKTQNSTHEQNTADMKVVKLPPATANKKQKALSAAEQQMKDLRNQLKAAKQEVRAEREKEEAMLPQATKAYKILRRTALQFIKSVRKEDWEQAQGLLENELRDCLKQIIAAKQ